MNFFCDGKERNYIGIQVALLIAKNNKQKNPKKTHTESYLIVDMMGSKVEWAVCKIPLSKDTIKTYIFF